MAYVDFSDFSGSSAASAYISSHSPFSSDSRKMSRPPMSSPLRMICGNAEFKKVSEDVGEHRTRLTWPVIELLESLAHSLITQDVKPRELDPLFAQQADRLSRESTFRRRWVALHEQHDLVLVHQLPASFVELFLGFVGGRDRRCRRSRGLRCRGEWLNRLWCVGVLVQE